jgi:hypothetical protein
MDGPVGCRERSWTVPTCLLERLRVRLGLQWLLQGYHLAFTAGVSSGSLLRELLVARDFDEANEANEAAAGCSRART